MERFSLKGLVINSDTIHPAQLQGENLWKKAETEPSMVFLGPEQLSSPGFNNLSSSKKFRCLYYCAFFFVGVEGASFSLFESLGHARLRIEAFVLFIRGVEGLELIPAGTGLMVAQLHGQLRFEREISIG